MLKTKKLTILVLLVLILIFVIMGFRETHEDPYNRVYNNETVLIMDKGYLDKVEDVDLRYTNSDYGMALVNEVYEKDSISNYILTFIKSDIQNDNDTISVQLPQHSFILHASIERVFFKKGFGVYEHKIIENTTHTLTSPNIKIFNVFPMNENTLLCLGNIYDSQTKINNFCFFTYNLKNRQVQKVLQTLDNRGEGDIVIKNSLRYAGRFIKVSCGLAYIYDKYGKVILFNNDGDFFKEISTIDKVDLPEITSFNDMYTYKRGAAFSSNSTLFIYKDKLFTFSCKPWEGDFMIIDCYDVKSCQYKSSIKLEYEKKGSRDVNFSFHDTISNKLLLGFKNSYQGFTIK